MAIAKPKNLWSLVSGSNLLFWAFAIVFAAAGLKSVFKDESGGQSAPGSTAAEADGGETIFTVLWNAYDEFVAVSAANPLIFLLIVLIGFTYFVSKESRRMVGTVATIIFCIALIMAFADYNGWVGSDGNGQEENQRQTARRSAAPVAPAVGPPDWVTVSFGERTRIAKLPGRCVVVAKEWSPLVDYQNRYKHIELSLREPGPPQDIFINKHVSSGIWWGGYQCPHA